MQMRLTAVHHQLPVSVVFHGNLDKILVDSQQHRIRRVEVRVKEHSVCLNLEGTERLSVNRDRRLLSTHSL